MKAAAISVQVQFAIYDDVTGVFIGTGAIVVQVAESGAAIAQSQVVRNTATGQPAVNALKQIEASQYTALIEPLIEKAKQAAATLPTMPPAPVPAGL